ncbi:MAG: pyrroloquinoline quinone biosynthesis protein C [Cyanobacteria bacterium DS2.3.42]|nr:pyrroloquinoline quinone biosynthesis protein C [Cyanobacteria bacterium DS2.3.42]
MIDVKSSRFLTAEQFVERLKKIGELKYHDKHPFHKKMHDGLLSKAEIQRWIANRFYYQKCLPIKDALVLSKLPEREDRIKWRERIIDHDGSTADDGGINAWLKFGEAAGIPSRELLEGTHLLPGVVFAVDAYVNYCRLNEWWLAVASSLTEVFAPTLVSYRIEVLERHYSWIDQGGLNYFRNRLSQAPRDSEHGLALVLTASDTFEKQTQALQAVEFKCDVLWSMLDAIEND